MPNYDPIALNFPTTTATFGGNDANIGIDQIIICTYAFSIEDVQAVYAGSYSAFYAGLIPDSVINLIHSIILFLRLFLKTLIKALPYPIPEYTDVAPQQQTPGVQCGHNQYWNPAMGIVGGTDAKEFEFPSQVSIQWNVGGFNTACGGSIIDANWVLTDASCCEGATADYKIYYKLGINQSLFDETTDARNAAQVIQHPDWDLSSLKSAFCLIQVDSPFDLSNPTEAQPACLPTDCATEKCLPDEDVLIVGLGSIYHGGPFSETLLKTYQVIMEDSVCASQYLGWNSAAGRYFCAWIENQGMAGACFGDNGGPLFCYKNGYLMIQGITAGGARCESKVMNSCLFCIVFYSFNFSFN